MMLAFEGAPPARVRTNAGRTAYIGHRWSSHKRPPAAVDVATLVLAYGRLQQLLPMAPSGIVTSMVDMSDLMSGWRAHCVRNAL
jgi:hypothetical protein